MGWEEEWEEEEWEEEEEDEGFIPGEDCDLSGADTYCLHCPYWGGDGICLLPFEDWEEAGEEEEEE